VETTTFSSVKYVVHTFTFDVKSWRGLDCYRKIVLCWYGWPFNLVDKYQIFAKSCSLAVRDITMKTKTASVSKTTAPRYRAAGFRVSENRNWLVTEVKTCLSLTKLDLRIYLIKKKQAIKMRGNITSVNEIVPLKRKIKLKSLSIFFFFFLLQAQKFKTISRL